jgi:beta-galactosidase
MIELKDKQILIDGRPRILIGGEIHYFRLKRADWQDRIAKLKAAGGNLVASYIPWLMHEAVEGQIDLEGQTQPNLDLGAFIDLCKDNGLYFFARPGPFIMAEMKNEGLPYWLYTKHPAIIPVSWDGKLAPTRTVDYLAPGFLEAVRHWYQAVMGGVIAPRLHTHGGNIIAVQLDNEIGMLSWITNAPDLTDAVLADFAAWLEQNYDPAMLQVRYPFVLDNAEIRAAAIRSPKEEYATHLLRDLGYFMRDRYARYVATLRGYAEDCGVTGVPFVINIHGTDRGRGLTFPVGISQLYEAYTQAPGYVGGSDHYLGDLSTANFQDLYLLNAFMDAVNRPDQPLTSVEFEAGSGDYGENYGGRLDPSTVDFKVRMCVAQGNRLLNYYLFSGGVNDPLPQPVNDGNDRIAFTGERHGFGAPVNPEGVLNYTYARLARSTKTVLALADKLAAMEEEHDGVAFAFIPDYYMTEYRYPESARMLEIVGNLEADRGPGAWEIVARAMLLGGYRFGAVNIQDRQIDPVTTPVLVLPSARYMAGQLQQKMVDYLRAGGGILLYGEVPLFDMEGTPCTVLADALGLRAAGFREASRFYYLSVYAEAWMAPHAEIRTHYAQVWEPTTGEVILRVVGTGEPCGFDIPVGPGEPALPAIQGHSGRIIAITTAYNCDIPLFRTALEKLGARVALHHDCPFYGIFMTTTGSQQGERFLHILNLDGFDKTVHLTENGHALLEGRPLVLRGREGLLLPQNVAFADVRIVYSTAEIVHITSDGIAFRLTQPEDVIALETDRQIATDADYRVERRGKTVVITSRKHAAVDDRLTICWS